MDNKNIISAIIPAYNCAAFLPQAIASIRSQTRPVDEIIVVDDGSSDNTEQVIKDLGADIRYIQQPNAGPSAARNRGIRAAKGSLIAFLDADDQWLPEKTEEQLHVLERYPELALIASDMAETDENSNIVIDSMLTLHGFADILENTHGAPIPDALSKMLQKNFIPTGTVLVKRHALEEANLFNTEIRYGEDLELWAKIAARHAVTCLPRVHMLRRRHGANATDATENMLIDLIKVMKNTRQWCNDTLRSQGGDPDLLVAKALTDLGYWYFDHDAIAVARDLFQESLHEKLTRRALGYRLACMLPGALISGIRFIKQKLH